VRKEGYSNNMKWQGEREKEEHVRPQQAGPRSESARRGLNDDDDADDDDRERDGDV